MASERKAYPTDVALYTLPGFPTGLPKKWVVTEESKKLFERGRFGQGYAVVAWKGEDKVTGEEIMCIGLCAAFNGPEVRGDIITHRTDKDGKPYAEDEFVESEEKLGTNTGIIHKRTVGNLFRRPEQRPKDGINLQQLFGAGIFKGDQFKLLEQFRNKSASLNDNSVQYNPEYLLANFFESRALKMNMEPNYRIRRCLPGDITKKLYEALITQLPCDARTYRGANRLIDLSEHTFESLEAIEWKISLASPLKTNRKLADTLLITVERGRDEDLSPIDTNFYNFINKIIHYINKNLLRMSTAEVTDYFSQYFFPRYLECLEIAFRNNDKELQTLLVDAYFSLPLPANVDAIKALVEVAEKNNSSEIVALLRNRELEFKEKSPDLELKFKTEARVENRAMWFDRLKNIIPDMTAGLITESMLQNNEEIKAWMMQPSNLRDFEAQLYRLMAKFEKINSLEFSNVQDVYGWLLNNINKENLDRDLDYIISQFKEYKLLGLKIPLPSAENIFSSDSAYKLIDSIEKRIFEAYDITLADFGILSSRLIKRIPDLEILRKAGLFSNEAAREAVVWGSSADLIISVMNKIAEAKIDDSKIIKRCLQLPREASQLIEVIKFLKPEDKSYQEVCLYNSEYVAKAFEKITTAREEGFEDEPGIRQLILKENNYFDRDSAEKEFALAVNALKLLKTEGLYENKFLREAVLKDMANSSDYIRMAKFLKEIKLDADEAFNSSLFVSMWKNKVEGMIEAYHLVKNHQPDLDVDFLKKILLVPDLSTEVLAAYAQMKASGSPFVESAAKSAIMTAPGEAKAIIAVCMLVEHEAPEFRDKIIEAVKLHPYQANYIKMYVENIKSYEADVLAAIFEKPAYAKFFIDTFKELKSNGMLDADVRSGIFEAKEPTSNYLGGFSFESNVSVEENILRGLRDLKEKNLYDRVDLRAEVINAASVRNEPVEEYYSSVNSWYSSDRFFQPSDHYGDTFGFRDEAKADDSATPPTQDQDDKDVNRPKR